MKKTNDKEIIAIRRGWQAGLTLSQTFKRMNKRFGFENKAKLIAEWRSMKKLFGCASAPVSYIEGYIAKNKEYTASELNARISNIDGVRTYGEWAGITGPGQRFRQMIKQYSCT